DWLGVDGPTVGGGGTLGACLAGWLAAWLHPVGQVLVFGAVACLGLMLAFDFVVFKAFGRFWCASHWFYRRFLGSARWLAGLSWTWTRPKKAAPRPSFARFVPKVVQESTPIATVAEPSSTVPIHRTGQSVELADTNLAAKLASPSDDDRFANYEPPDLSLLDDPQPGLHQEHDQVLRDRAALLEKTFTDFGLRVRVVGIHTGPVITQYELALETGLRVY